MKIMLEEITEAMKNKQEYKLYMFRNKHERLKKEDNGFYPHITNDVWKGLLSMGLVERKRKGDTIKFSKKFCRTLNTISEYWSNYVDNYVEAGE
jgi:hypothetical protein